MALSAVKQITTQNLLNCQVVNPEKANQEYFVTLIKKVDC